MSKKVRVLYHDNCFDGLASAAVFARFYHDALDSQAEINFTGLAHRPGQLIDEDVFNGEENAIVDFKYSRSERLTWWFDHHQSAFVTTEDEAHFRQDRSGKKFYDPGFKSCTKFIASVLKDRFNYDSGQLSELIEWADIVDGAQYPDAKAATELTHPAMKLVAVIETTRDPALLHQIIRDMQQKSLSEIVERPEIDSLIGPIIERQNRSMKTIGDHAECKDGVLYFDVSGYDVEGYNKFIPYYLFPEAVYSVSVSNSPKRTKVSLGYNPWCGRPRMHNLASICERYGGGGHAVVGAISLRPDQLDWAREIAREVVEELRDGLREERRNG